MADSPYIDEREKTRTSEVGFQRLEPGSPADASSPTVAEVTAAIVRTDFQPWRADFRSGGIGTDDWQIVSQAPSATAANITAGQLVIPTGTVANEFTQIRSTRRFRLPVRISVAASLSQRIANQTFYIELISKDGMIYARWKFDGTTATAAKCEVGSGLNNNQNDIAATITTSASLQNFEIDLAIDEVNFNTRVIDSPTNSSTKVTRSRNLPHPGDDLYIQFRAVNGGTNPASNTNFIIDNVMVQDVNELAVEVTGGRGNSGLGQSIPVFTTSTTTVAATAATTDMGLIGAKKLGGAAANLSVASIAAGATFTSPSQDLAATNGYSTIRALFNLDQTGIGFIDSSADGTTWFRQAEAPLVAAAVTGTGAANFLSLSCPAVMRYYRVGLKNTGASASTAATGTRVAAGVTSSS